MKDRLVQTHHEGWTFPDLLKYLQTIEAIQKRIEDMRQSRRRKRPSSELEDNEAESPNNLKSNNTGSTPNNKFKCIVHPNVHSHDTDNCYALKRAIEDGRIYHPNASNDTRRNYNKNNRREENHAFHMEQNRKSKEKKKNEHHYSFDRLGIGHSGDTSSDSDSDE